MLPGGLHGLYIAIVEPRSRATNALTVCGSFACPHEPPTFASACVSEPSRFLHPSPCRRGVPDGIRRANILSQRTSGTNGRLRRSPAARQGRSRTSIRCYFARAHHSGRRPSCTTACLVRSPPAERGPIASRVGLGPSGPPWPRFLSTNNWLVRHPEQSPDR